MYTLCIWRIKQLRKGRDTDITDICESNRAKADVSKFMYPGSWAIGTTQIAGVDGALILILREICYGRPQCLWLGGDAQPYHYTSHIRFSWYNSVTIWSQWWLLTCMDRFIQA